MARGGYKEVTTNISMTVGWAISKIMFRYVKTCSYSIENSTQNTFALKTGQSKFISIVLAL